jgi:hypothetical protein
MEKMVLSECYFFMPGPELTDFSVDIIRILLSMLSLLHSLSQLSVDSVNFWNINAHKAQRSF